MAEFTAKHRYSVAKDSVGNLLILKNKDVMCIFHGEYAVKYFDRKIEELEKRGIVIEWEL